MEQFNAHKFVKLMIHLGQLNMMCFLDNNSSRNIEPDRMSIVRTQMEQISQECHQLGLDLSNSQIKRLLKIEQYTYDGLERKIGELISRIEDELSNEIFMYIPKEKAKYFSKSREFFGNTTLDAFPQIVQEVEEAGKCYATGRNTSCVFHLMRIMEFGLKRSADSLKVQTDTNRSWGINLKKMEEASEDQHKQDDFTDFYNGLIARLYTVKDAWRNPTMHIERFYGEEEALDIFNSVSSFMRHLSTKLSGMI